MGPSQTNGLDTAQHIRLPEVDGVNTNGAFLGVSRPSSPSSFQWQKDQDRRRMMLELSDGTQTQGYSFGAEKSMSGELVFQTGMVGYPESITDPSYRGQILVVTYPLVGNYGVPSRDTRDSILDDLPAHFEAAEIHVAGLVVATYADEEYSHYLATSSLGQWLKEQGVPALYGVDTRALTKKIRDEGSMLGRLRLEASHTNGGPVNGHNIQNGRYAALGVTYEDVEWRDPNKSNLVAAGENTISLVYENDYLTQLQCLVVNPNCTILSSPVNCVTLLGAP